MKQNIDHILHRAAWPAPPQVHAFTTLTNYPEENLSYRGDGDQVKENQKRLYEFIAPDETIQWVKTIHSNKVLELPCRENEGYDAVFTMKKGVVCGVTAADCLPVLFTNFAGDRVAVAHGGWRGLKAGVMENTLTKLRIPPEETLIWLGPAISKQYYEVGPDVLDSFDRHDSRLQEAYYENCDGKFQLDLYKIARNIFGEWGVPLGNVYGGEFCVFSDRRFHSVRRDGKDAGRAATFIWIR